MSIEAKQHNAHYVVRGSAGEEFGHIPRGFPIDLAEAFFSLRAWREGGRPKGGRAAVVEYLPLSTEISCGTHKTGGCDGTSITSARSK